MAQLVSQIPCKKLRRSQRLETKEKCENTCRTINVGPLGYFEIIPLELKFLVFTYLKVEELSMLTIASKSMRNTIELYRNSSWAPQFKAIRDMTHVPLSAEDKIVYSVQFRRLGLLMKRSSCLYTTKDRLKLLQQFMRKYLCNFCKACLEPTKCIALTGYGLFLHTVIAGWDDKECSRTFEYIGEQAHILKKLANVVKSKPGAFMSEELHVRLFLRRVFIDQCKSKTDKAFWLNLILKPYPMVQQARIIFLLYGPLYGEELQWFDMCESIPVNKDHAQICFGELANAFKLLHFYNKQWSEDTIISVIDEITYDMELFEAYRCGVHNNNMNDLQNKDCDGDCVLISGKGTPDEWLPENTANLLFLCGDCITLKVLSSKAINGRVQELGSIITSLCLVCWRHSQPVTWAVDIVHNLCSLLEHPRERVSFLHTIIDTFREVILDLHEFGDSEDDGSQDFQNMMDAQADFSRELIILAFQNIIKA